MKNRPAAAMVVGRCPEDEQTGSSRRRLGPTAIDLRVHSKIVEWTGDDRDNNRPRFRAVIGMSIVVPALAPGDRADDEPNDDDDCADRRASAHLYPLMGTFQLLVTPEPSLSNRAARRPPRVDIAAPRPGGAPAEEDWFARSTVHSL